VYGPEHPGTLDAMANLAISYDNTGRIEEALTLKHEVLAMRRKEFGSESPETLKAMSHLAYSFDLAGRKEEALALNEEVLKLRRRVLGPEHPETLWAMHKVANSYDDYPHSLEEALKLRREVLALRRKVLGPDHEDTFLAMRDFAATQINTGNYEDGYKMLEECLAQRRRTLGAEHRKTLKARQELAEVTWKIARSESFLKLFGCEPLGAASPAVVTALVKPDSEWRWLHPEDDVESAASGPDFDRRFFLPGYDDSGWSAGTDSEGPFGGFGYGDEKFSGVDIGAPEDNARVNTAYFRHRFATNQEFTHLELRCRRDDGIIVYLDGREVIRNNVDEGPEAYDLPATRTVSETMETTLYRFPLGDLVLPAGEHVLAISLHNTARPSSDLSIGAISLVKVEEPAGAGP
jgi:hypothetical protein